MMPAFTVRLGERLEHGRTKHGDASFHWPAGELVRLLGTESADVAGWAWILHERAACYSDDAAREAIQLACVEMAVLAIRMWRVVATLWGEADLLPPLPVTAELMTRRFPETWCDVRDPLPAHRVYGSRIVDQWADLVERRVAAGRHVYGDESFGRTGAELCIEIGDEACAVAGWAWVLDAQLSGHGGTVRRGWEPQLRALCAVAQSAYRRAQAAQLLCIEQEGASVGQPDPGRVAIPPFLRVSRTREAREVYSEQTDRPKL